MLKNKFRFIIVLLLFISCSKPPFFTRYKNIDNNTWAIDKSIDFNIAVTDTLSAYNIFINIRNTDQYPYSNLFLVVTETYQNTILQIDTLEYEMADARGHWLGSGYSSVKENKLIYKTNYTFPKKGQYSFNIVHAVRKNGRVFGDEFLKGISDVGLQIENTKSN